MLLGRFVLYEQTIQTRQIVNAVPYHIIIPISKCHSFHRCGSQVSLVISFQGDTEVIQSQPFVLICQTTTQNPQFLLPQKYGSLLLLLYFSKHGQLDLFKASESISDHLTSIFPENSRFFCLFLHGLHQVVSVRGQILAKKKN